MALTEKSYAWTTGTTNDGSTTFTQADLAEWMRIIAACNNSVGVAGGYLNAFAATIPGANAVQIDTGAAVVDGHAYSNLGAGNIAIASAVGGGNTRIDRIVLRADWANHQVRITRIAGTDAASPTAPAITQTPGTTYDVMLFQVTVNTTGVVTVTTDERVWARVSSLNQIADLLITAAKIAAATITGAKVAATTIAGSNMVANTVNTGQMALNSVDDTIAGNRVPQMYRRQGGSATDWNSQGTSTQTPAAVRMQGGCINVPTGGSGITITFPVAFSQPPIFFATLAQATGGVTFYAFSLDAATAQIVHSSGVTQTFNWLAIGTE